MCVNTLNFGNHIIWYMCKVSSNLFNYRKSMSIWGIGMLRVSTGATRQHAEDRQLFPASMQKHLGWLKGGDSVILVNIQWINAQIDSWVKSISRGFTLIERGGLECLLTSILYWTLATYLIFVNFLHNCNFKIWKFYTWYCVNLQQNSVN